LSIQRCAHPLIAFATAALCGERTLQLIALLSGTHNLHLGIGALGFERNDAIGLLARLRFGFSSSLAVLGSGLARRPSVKSAARPVRALGAARGSAGISPQQRPDCSMR